MMRSAALAAVVALVGLVASADTPVRAHGPEGYGPGHGMMGPGMMGPGMMGPGMRMGPPYGAGYCPMMGSGFAPGYGHMGPHMGYGSRMGHGMGDGNGQDMGPGQGMRRGMGNGMPTFRDRDLDPDEVRHILEHQLAMQGNPRLKIGEVAASDQDTIVAEIVTQDGSLVQKYEVDRHTGQFRQAE